MTPAHLKERLTAAFPEASIEVRDQTGTEDHYEVVVHTDRFHGLTRLAQKREVMKVLDAELKSGEIHALTLYTGPKNG